MEDIRHRFSWLLLILFVFCTPSCTIHKREHMKKNKVADISTGDHKYILTAPIVSKNFVKKNGAPSSNKEIYIQRSIQDYYIKFCESKIKREVLEDYLANKTGLMKVVTLEVELKNGYWDICDENFMQQSRMGEYMIIHRIIDTE